MVGGMGRLEGRGGLGRWEHTGVCWEDWEGCDGAGGCLGSVREAGVSPCVLVAAQIWACGHLRGCLRCCMGPAACRTVELPAADERRHGGGGHQRVLAHDHLGEAVARCELDDGLGCLQAVVAPVASQGERLALDLISQSREQRLHPVGQVVLRGEDSSALPETARARLLALYRLRGHLVDLHRCYGLLLTVERGDTSLPLPHPSCVHTDLPRHAHDWQNTQHATPLPALGLVLAFSCPGEPS